MPDKNKPAFLSTINVTKDAANKQFTVQSDLDTNLLVGTDQEAARARHQGFAAELGNGLAGAALKIPGNVISNLAAIADIEDYYNQDNEIGNAITNFIQDKINPVIDEEFQVHQESDKPLNLGSREWWIKNGTSLAGSATEFALTGAAVGMALSPLALLGPVGGVAAKGLNALALNQAEAITSAREVYKNAYALNIKKGVGEEEAKQLAADAAAYTININRLNLPLNLSSASLFTKTPASTRKLIKEATKLGGAKRLLEEGAQEAGEEIINHIGTQEGNRRGAGEKYSVGNTIRDIFSAEGIEAGLLGAAGGVAQTGATNAMNDIRGINKEHNERYKAQQARLAELDEFNVANGGQALKDVLNGVQVKANLQNKIYEAEANHNDGIAQNLKNQLLQYQAVESFQTGTTDKLESLFEGIKNKPGTTGEEIVKANEAVQQIREWEKIYNSHIADGTPKEKIPHLFNNKVEKDNITKEMLANNQEIIQLTGDIKTKELNGIPTVQEQDKLKVLQAKQATLVIDSLTNASDYNEIRSKEFDHRAYSKKKFDELAGETSTTTTSEATPVVTPTTGTTISTPTSTVPPVVQTPTVESPEVIKTEAEKVSAEHTTKATLKDGDKFTLDVDGLRLKFKVEGGKVSKAISVLDISKNYKTGDVIKDGTPLDTKAKKLLQDKFAELSNLSLEEVEAIVSGKPAKEKVVVDKKGKEKEPEVSTESSTEVEELPIIEDQEVSFDEEIQGGYTLDKTTSQLREVLEKKEKNGEATENDKANLRFLNYVDTFEGNPRNIKLKVVTSKNREEYNKLIDVKEQEYIDKELAKDPNYVAVKLVVVDDKDNPIDKDGKPTLNREELLLTSPLKAETVDGKLNGGDETYAISPRHFLRMQGVEGWEKGEEHPEFKARWEAEVARKNEFRKQLESGTITYLNVIERSPGKLDNKKAEHISPTAAFFPNTPKAKYNSDKISDNGITPRYYVPTTKTKGGKTQIVSNKNPEFAFLADGETRELKVGFLYVIKDNVFYPLTARNLNPAEVKNIAAAFGNLPKAGKPELDLRNISNYVFITPTDKNYGENTLNYDATTKTINFGTKSIPAAEATTSQEFLDFLAKRKRQVSNNLLKTNPQVYEIGDNGRTLGEISYYDLLFGKEGKNSGFTIKSHPAGERQVTNSYFVYDSANPITTSITPAVEEAVQSTVTEESEKVDLSYFDTEEEGEVSEAEAEVISKVADGKIKPLSTEGIDFEEDEISFPDEDNRLASDTKGYNKEDIKKVSEWYTKQFGDTDLSITKDLIDGKAFGQFFKGITYLWENAEEGTLFHEAFHKVSRQYLTNAQRESLYAEYRKSSKKKLSDKQVEEALAEGFREYMLNGQKSINGKPVQNTIFRKLWRMIKSFVTGKKDIQEIYEKLAGKGFAKDKKVNNSTEKLNRFGIFNESKSKEINDTITSKLFTIVFANKLTPAQLTEAENRAVLIGTAYKGVKKSLSDSLKALIAKSQTEALTEQENDIFETYKYLVNNWETVVKQHTKTLNGLIDITIEDKVKDPKVAEERPIEESEEEGGEQEIEEISKGKSNDWDSSNEVSTVSTASNNTKMLLATLKQRDKDGKEVKNSLDEAKLLEFNDAYSFLLRNLKGLSSMSAMYSKIKETVAINPSMQSLVDRLPNPIDMHNLKQHEVQLWLDFWQDFHKSESRGTLTIVDRQTGDIYQVDANRHNLEERLKDVWKADLAKSKYTIKSGAANTLKKEVTAIPDYRTIEDDIKFLKNIGITFENWTTEELSKKIDSDKVDYIRTMINNALKEGKPVNDLFALASETGVGKGNLTELLSLAAEKSTKTVELSYINAEGKRIYSISLPDYHSLIGNAINESQTWQELIEVMPQLNSVSSKGSVWLNELFPVDKFGERGAKNPNANFTIDTIAGIRIEGEQDSGESITKADVATKFLQEFNDLFQTGKATAPRAADKSLDKVPGLVKDRDKALVIPINDIIRSGFKGDKVREVFVGTQEKPGYFLAELERIQLFNTQELGKKIDIYNKKAGDWTIFEDILSESTKKELAKNYTKTNEVPTDELLDVIADEVAVFLEKISVEGNEDYTTFPSVLQMMRNFKLIQGGKLVGVDKSLRTKKAEDLARAFAVNHLIQTIEYHKVIAGDKAFFKDPFKRYSGINATKKFCNNDGEVNAYLNKEENKKVNEHGFEYDAEKNFRAVVIADENVKSQIASEYVNATYKRLKDSGIAEEVAYNQALAQHEPYLTTEKNGKVKNNMTEADAQAFTNPVFHRHMLIKSSLWNFSKQEKQYQYEMAYMYVKLHERATLSKAEQQELYKGDYSRFELSPEALAKYQAIVDKGNPNYVINIQKGQYFGAQAGTVADNLNSPTFHKLSYAPMTWRLVEGTNNEDKLLNMLENQVGYMVFESGVKVGARVRENGSKPSFYDSEGNANLLSKSEFDEVVQVLPYNYLGIQVEIEAKVKEKVIFGSQFRKLFESNLFDNGINQVPELAALHSKYIKLINDLVEKEWDSLVKELGVELDSENNLVNMDVTKLVELLKKESESRQLANNLVESLKVDSAGKLLYPIDSLVNRNKLESLMVALVSSRVTRQKMPGDAMIQMANTGFEKKGKRTIGESNELLTYRKDNVTGKTLPMQVKVSMNAQYKKQLLVKYGTIENVNKAIKAGDIPKEALTMVGYRIPTQGPNSIEFMEIVGFTSDSQGNSIILPSEVVAKSGGDFDIDKLNIFRPNFFVKDPNQSLESFVSKKLVEYNKANTPLEFKEKYSEDELMDIIDSENRTEAEEVIANLVDTFYATIDTKEKKELKIVVAKGDSKAGKQNEIISIAKQMLEHEYMFEQLVTANSTVDMDKTVDAVRYAEYLATNPKKVMSKEEFKESLDRPLSGTQELMVGHIMNQFRDFLGGKRAVSSDAVHITAHLLFQQAGTKIGAINTQGEEITINMEVNKEGDDYLLGSRYNKNNNLISDIFSQIANLHLDAAKDPKYKDINLTQEVLPIAHFLNHLGASEDTIIYFLKQPAILELLAAKKKILADSLTKSEYVSPLKTLKEKYAKLAGLEVDKEGNIEPYTKVTLSKDMNDVLLDNIAGKVDPLLQLQVLEDFDRYRDYAQNLGSFMKAVNYDTTRFKDLAAIQYRLDTVEALDNNENRLFTKADYDAIMDNTIVGSFDKTKGTMSMFSHLFVTQNPEVRKVKEVITEEINPAQGSKLAERLPSMIDNDFIGYIVQRFGMYQGKKLYTHIDRLFKGDKSLARQLEGLKDVVKDNYLIDQLQGMLKDDIDNITMYTRKMTKHEQDVLTDLYRELSTYEGKDTVKVQEFMKDLTAFGILQSGLHNSPITFLSLIPNESYGDITKNAIEAYKAYGGNMSEGKKAIMEDFAVRFYLKNANNSQIVPNVKDYQGNVIKKNLGRFFTQIEETRQVKNKEGVTVKEKTGKVTLFQKGKEFKLPGAEFRKYGHRLQDFYLQDNDTFLETGKEDTNGGDGTKPPVTPTSSTPSIQPTTPFTKGTVVDSAFNPDALFDDLGNDKPTKKPTTKNVVVPAGASEHNLPIFEDENNVYLMNNGQQESYDFIHGEVNKLLKNRTFIADLDNLEGDIAFEDKLAAQYDNLIPEVMWNNMLGLAGRGGTGKTTVIKKIIEDLAGENKYSKPKVVYLTPTHTAATVLQEALGIDSESTSGIVSTMASFTMRSKKVGNNLELVDEETYNKYKEYGTPFRKVDIVVFDESSMVSKQDIKDILTRFKHEYNKLNYDYEAKEYRDNITPFRMPIFLFMGDYRQLGPVEKDSSKENNAVNKGPISSTILNNEDKSTELTQVMRSSSKLLHDIYDSVGNQIVTNMNKVSNGQAPVKLSLTDYDNLTNKSSENILVVNSVEGVIDDYTKYLSENNNPYGMFWIHYNNLAHANTKTLFNKIRQDYFGKLYKLGQVTEENLNELMDADIYKRREYIVGDYVEYTKALEINTTKVEVPDLDSKEYADKIKGTSIDKGQVKPRSRYKVLDIFEDETSLKDMLGYEVMRYFDKDLILDREVSVLYNRQDRVRAITTLLNAEVTDTYFEEGRFKGRKITITNKNSGKSVSATISYAEYKRNKLEEVFAQLGTKEPITKAFSPSYIGSSHTAQGNSIKNVIVGDYNIRENLSKGVNQDDAYSSLYTAITRTSSKLVIIKNTPIENNQEVFTGFTEDKGKEVETTDKKEVKASARDIKAVEVLLQEGMSVEEIVRLNLHRGLSEQELTKLSEELNPKESMESSKIYSELGSKTKSGNVVIESVYQQKGIAYAKSIGGIFSMRVDRATKHFGNPFSSVKAEIEKGLIPTKSTRESVEKYIDWVINSEEPRAQWIRETLKSGVLKNKPVVYYKELGEPSHATALDYLINKYDWSVTEEAESKETGKDLSPKEQIMEPTELVGKKFINSHGYLAGNYVLKDVKKKQIRVNKGKTTYIYDRHLITVQNTDNNKTYTYYTDFIPETNTFYAREEANGVKVSTASSIEFKLTEKADSELEESPFEDANEYLVRLQKEYGAENVDAQRFKKSWEGAQAIGMTFEEFKKNTEEQLDSCGSI